MRVTLKCTVADRRHAVGYRVGRIRLALGITNQLCLVLVEQDAIHITVCGVVLRYIDVCQIGTFIKRSVANRCDIVGNFDALYMITTCKRIVSDPFYGYSVVYRRYSKTRIGTCTDTRNYIIRFVLAECIL